MRRAPLTGVTEGVFDSIKLRVPPYTGELIEAAALIEGSGYDDTQVLADVSSAAAGVASNAAAIATQAAAVSANATAIAGKVDNSRVLTDVPAGALFTDTVYTHPVSHNIFEISGLSSALGAKLDADQRPQIKYQGGYVDMQKLEFSDSTLSLGAATGEYQIQSTPQLASVQGLTAALAAKSDVAATVASLALKRNVADSYTVAEVNAALAAGLATKQNTLPNAASLDATSSVQTQLNDKASTAALSSALAGKQDALANAANLDATSSVQTQLNAKATTAALSSGLAGKWDALANAANLDATSSVQTQLNSKASSAALASGLATKQNVLPNASSLDATSSVQTQLNSKRDDVASKK